MSKIARAAANEISMGQVTGDGLSDYDVEKIIDKAITPLTELIKKFRAGGEEVLENHRDDVLDEKGKMCDCFYELENLMKEADKVIA